MDQLPTGGSTGERHHRTAASFALTSQPNVKVSAPPSQCLLSLSSLSLTSVPTPAFLPRKKNTMWVVNPSDQSITPMEALLPDLDKQMIKHLKAPLDVKDYMPAHALPLVEAARQMGRPIPNPYEMLIMGSAAANHSVLEYVMAAQILSPCAFKMNPILASYKVAVDPLEDTLAAGRNVFLWNLDFPTKEEYNAQAGAYYGPRFFAGKTIILARSADGKLADLAEGELPAIAFREPGRSNYKNRGEYSVEMKTDGRGKLTSDEQIVYVCARCKGPCKDDSIRCMCGVHTYCSEEHRDVRPHCGPCAVCEEPATAHCARCSVLWYCGKAHQAMDWKAGHSRVCIAPKGEGAVAAPESHLV